MRRAPRAVLVGIVMALVAMMMIPATATASDDAEAPVPSIVVENGVTQPVFSYQNAIQEVVYVEAPMDSDGDGANDLIAVDVIRPAETEAGLKVPSIMEASPYFGRSANPPPDGTRGFPGWWDEYFVPRGYAIVQVEMQGTGRSFGCPVTGGAEDTISIKAAVDWLNGRAPGQYYNGTPAVADWSTGFVGMQGVSYVGTLPNAVAAQNVDGLRTIVPIAAISSWYDYVNDQGIGWNSWAGALGGRYTLYLANYVQESRDLPGSVNQPLCVPKVEAMGAIEQANVPAYDFIPFWQERNYVPDSRNIKKAGTSVFMVHGLTDFNVKTMHMSRLWREVERRDMPRKIWIHRGAHVNPTSIRNAEWQRVMHLWMDRWLHRVRNDIMNEPMLDVQRPDGSWETHSSWPDVDAEAVELHFGPATEGVAGTLSADGPTSSDGTQSFVDVVASESVKIGNAEAARAGRLAYVTEPLTQDVRISGTPQVELRVSSSVDTALLSAMLVDYGEAPTITTESKDPLVLVQESCEPEDLENRTGCAEPMEVDFTITPERVLAHGHLDLKNYADLRIPRELRPGRMYTARWDTLPSDHVIPAGHRIGIVITGNYNTANSQLRPSRDNAALGAEITVQLNRSKAILPIVGGAGVLD